jgi:hypothetical protein
VRELAHGILPSVLSHGGQPAGVDAFVSRLDLPVDFEVLSERLPRDIEASAYFIIAEGLTNVVKHARATRATVWAAADDGVLAIEVRDDETGGAQRQVRGTADGASPSRGGSCGSCSIRRARHRALGRLDPGPDVHVDDDADDLEHLLRAEVLDERVVEALERRVPIGVGGAGERLGVAEGRPLGLGVKLSLPPRGQGVDLGPRDARLARRLVVQVQAVGAVVECDTRRRRSWARPRSIRRSAVYPNASAPIRAMPISASFSLASNRRFAIWTSSAISLPFECSSFALPMPPGPRYEPPARDLLSLHRRGAIENGDRAPQRLTTRLGE